MSNLEYLLKWSLLEDEKIKLNLKTFDSEVVWMTEIFLLIQKLENELKNTEYSYQVSIGLFHMAVKDVHLSFLSLFRSHISLAYKSMRSAIEAATFINAIQGNAEKASIWLKKEMFDQNDENYKRLLINGREGVLGQQLKSRFNFASEQSHANLIKLINGRRTELLIEEKTITDTYSYFDEDEDWLIAHAHHLIGDALLLLHVFEVAFETQIEGSDFKQTLDSKSVSYNRYILENLNRILIGPKMGVNGSSNKNPLV